MTNVNKNLRAEASFEAIRQRGDGRTRPRTCPVCGEETAGGVQVLLTRKTSGRKSTTVVTTSRTFCERHAVALYRRMEAVRAEFLEGGGHD